MSETLLQKPAHPHCQGLLPSPAPHRDPCILPPSLSACTLALHSGQDQSLLTYSEEQTEGSGLTHPTNHSGASGASKVAIPKDCRGTPAAGPDFSTRLPTSAQAHDGAHPPVISGRAGQAVDPYPQPLTPQPFLSPWEPISSTPLLSFSGAL